MSEFQWGFRSELPAYNGGGGGDDFEVCFKEAAALVTGRDGGSHGVARASVAADALVADREYDGGQGERGFPEGIME